MYLELFVFAVGKRAHHHRKEGCELSLADSSELYMIRFVYFQRRFGHDMPFDWYLKTHCLSIFFSVVVLLVSLP